jgi:hypothetical protein
MPDPLAMVSRSPVLVKVAGIALVVRYQPVGAWLAHLSDPFTVAYTMADDGKDDLFPVLARGRAREDLSKASTALLRTVSGRDMWWETVRLASLGATDLLGELTLRGVDPWNVSIGQWCSAVYTACTRHADMTGRMRFDAQLSFPPAGYEDEWDDGVDPDATEAAMAGIPGLSIGG